MGRRESPLLDLQGRFGRGRQTAQIPPLPQAGEVGRWVWPGPEPISGWAGGWGEHRCISRRWTRKRGAEAAQFLHEGQRSPSSAANPMAAKCASRALSVSSACRRHPIPQPSLGLGCIAAEIPANSRGGSRFNPGHLIVR